jgi:pimeloyl-ACP methyl ester carboxylesterase
MSRALRIIVTGGAITYFGLCGTLFIFQRSLIYFPPPAAKSDQTFTLPIAGAHVLVSTHPSDQSGALIYFGGNSEDVSATMPTLSTTFPDRGIYLLRYRGYGGSSGAPSEAALFQDALTVFDVVAKKHSKIDVVGRSLGSGIAVYVASRRPAAKLVLVTPYDSIEELAARQFPYVPVKWILLDKFESWRFAPQITSPTLIVAAERDQIVPRASTDLLRSRFRSGIVSFAVVPGTTHNTICDDPEYLRLLEQSGMANFLPSCEEPYRSDLKPARTSSEKSFGCSHAAKWPPLGSLL